MTLAAIDSSTPLAGSSLVAWAEQAEAAAGIARALVATAFCPDSLKVRRHDGTLDFDASVATVAAALLTGQELGLDPMASLRSIDVIPPGSGTPALRAVALRALVQHAGHDIWVAESTDTRAVVRGQRNGTATVMESKWTIDRARRMKLRGFGPDGNYTKMPAPMLVARATAECARWIAADVILGLPYIVEEIEDPGEPEPVPAEPATSPAPQRTARRKSRLRPVLPAPAPDDAGGEPAGPEPEPMSPSQRGKMWAGLKRIGLTTKDDALPALSAWIGREVERTSDLTADEASAVIAAIDAEEARRAAAGPDTEEENDDHDQDE